MKNPALATRNWVHGEHGTRTYKSWTKMIARCYNRRNIGFHNYGGSGVRVCRRWRSYANFVADMGKRPSIRYSIDRFPDRSGNYKPGNCRWATSKQQSNNKASNRFIEIAGQTKTLAQWAECAPVSYATVFMRLKNGWPIHEALTRPRQYRFNSYGSLAAKKRA